MKKFIASVATLILFFAFAIPVLAVKPIGNLAGAQKVEWNLSGDVMPSPPWGLNDLVGSDTLSKLVVNQPNGNMVEIAITGVMNGLNPNTEYQVYPSNGWSSCEKWNVEGNWNLSFMYNDNPYNHNMSVMSQNMYTGQYSGTGSSYTTANTYWDILNTSKVVGDTITLDLIYTGVNPGYTVLATGTIDENGNIINGSWTSSAAQVGTWSSYGGRATEESVGCGYPGLFPGQEMFTFITDENGHGSWHINMKNADFPAPGIHGLSIWINKPGATILISDNFDVEVE